MRGSGSEGVRDVGARGAATRSAGAKAEAEPSAGAGAGVEAEAEPSAGAGAGAEAEPGRGSRTFDAQAARDDKLTFSSLVWIFVTMSFFGLLGESVVSFFQDGFWKNRVGLLWGPLSPIYGCGAVILTIVLHAVREKSVALVFALGAVAGATFEWLAGFFFEHAFGIVAWSYEGQVGNLGGHTSLLMAAVWGTLGVLWIKGVYPLLMRALNRIPARLSTVLAAAVAAFLVVDAAFTLTAFDCWYGRLAGEEPVGAIECFFADYYDNDFMASRFETMSLWPDLANR